MKLLVDEVSDQDVSKKLHEVYYISIELRAAISLSARIENFGKNDLALLKEHCNNVYTASALTQSRVSPSIWTLGNAVPFYSCKTFEEYGLGLGRDASKNINALQSIQKIQPTRTDGPTYLCMNLCN